MPGGLREKHVIVTLCESPETPRPPYISPLLPETKNSFRNVSTLWHEAEALRKSSRLMPTVRPVLSLFLLLIFRYVSTTNHTSINVIVTIIYFKYITLTKNMSMPIFVSLWLGLPLYKLLVTDRLGNPRTCEIVFFFCRDAIKLPLNNHFYLFHLFTVLIC